MTVQLKKIDNIGARHESQIDRGFTLEMIRVTEAGARAAAREVGQQKAGHIEAAAAKAMLRALNDIGFCAQIVTECDGHAESQSLPVGQLVGAFAHSTAEFDIAIEPIDGTSLAMKGMPDAISALALGQRKSLLPVPNMPMLKLAAGRQVDLTKFDLLMQPAAIIAQAAEQLRSSPQELVVAMLSPETSVEQATLVEKMQATGARIRLLAEADIAGCVSTALPRQKIDLFYGIGPAPSGVIAAAGLRGLGGNILAKLLPDLAKNRAQIEREAELSGIENLDTQYHAEDLAGGEVFFAATGITTGYLLHGIDVWPLGEQTESLLTRSATGTVRWMTALHKS